MSIIRNEQELAAAKVQAEAQRAWLDEQRKELLACGMDEEESNANLREFLNRLYEVQEEIAWYENARAGGAQAQPFNLDEIGRFLVGSRIAAGLSEGDLAARIPGSNAASVAKLESGEYLHANLLSILAIMHALDLQLGVTLVEPWEESLADDGSEEVCDDP
jgi:hypothetical protein